MGECPDDLPAGSGITRLSLFRPSGGWAGQRAVRAGQVQHRAWRQAGGHGRDLLAVADQKYTEWEVKFRSCLSDKGFELPKEAGKNRLR
jgi:hypothetical protein